MIMFMLASVGCLIFDKSTDLDTETEDYTAELEEQTSLITTWNKDNNKVGARLYEITEDSETGYVLDTASTTHEELQTSAGFDHFRIDTNLLYSGRGFDGPAKTIDGEIEYYDASELDNHTISISEYLVMGNLESEKTFGFPEENKHGSLYVSISSSHATQSSFARPVSDEILNEHPWYSSFKGFLSTNGSLASDAIFGSEDDEIESLFFPAVHNDNSLDSYWRNIAGAFKSELFEEEGDIFKQEAGELAQIDTFTEPLQIASLPEGYVTDNPIIGLTFYESDAIFGMTQILKATVAVQAPLNDLDVGDRQFEVSLFHDLGDPKSVFIAYCKNGEALPNHESYIAENQKNVSEAVCPSGLDIYAGMAALNLTIAENE